MESVTTLLRQFTMSYSEKSLQDKFDSLSQIPDFAKLISFSCFKKFLKDDLGICFAKLNTIKSNVDAIPSKTMRRTLSLTVMKLIAEGHLVLFFDASLTSESTFRTKLWKLRKTKHIQLDWTNIAGTINIVLLASIARL